MPPDKDEIFYVGEFDTAREAALAHDRAMLIIDPDTPREDLIPLRAST